MAVALQPAQEVSTMKKPPTKQRRVVVTGLGVVTSLGHDPDVFYNNLLDGVSGISEINAFDCAEFPTVNDVSFKFYSDSFSSRLLLLILVFAVSRELLVRSSLSQPMAG